MTKFVNAVAALALLLGMPLAAAAQVRSARLTMAQAARQALGTHPSLALSLAERDRSEALRDGARAAWLPRVTAEMNGVRFQEPMIVAPLHGFDPTMPPEFDRLLVQGNLAASWLVFDGGARSARGARAVAVRDAAEAGIAATESDLLVRAAQEYLAVATAREMDTAQRARVTALESALDRVRQLEAEGRAARVDVIRSEAGLSRARADVAANTAEVLAREGDLARVMGSTLATVRAAFLETPTVSLAAPDRTALLDRTLEANPRVVRARHQVAAAQALVRESRGTWLPSVTAGAQYNAFGSSSTRSAAEWQGALRVSYALFTGGLRSSLVARAEAERSMAEHMLRLAGLEVAAAVDGALAALAQAGAQVEALEAAVEQFEAVVAVERLSLDAGAGVQSEYLDAESQLVEARAALAAARAARVLARVELARAAGELNMDWIIQNVEQAP